VPVGHLLEGVAGPKNQRLSHMSTNNLESDRKTVGCFTAGQCSPPKLLPRLFVPSVLRVVVRPVLPAATRC
jgi:hypothetical protein